MQQWNAFFIDPVAESREIGLIKIIIFKSYNNCRTNVAVDKVKSTKASDVAPATFVKRKRKKIQADKTENVPKKPKSGIISS